MNLELGTMEKKQIISYCKVFSGIHVDMYLKSLPRMSSPVQERNGIYFKYKKSNFTT